jgi:hypothetical protein
VHEEIVAFDFKIRTTIGGKKQWRRSKGMSIAAASSSERC